MNPKELEERIQAEKEAIQNCEDAVYFDLGTIQPFGYLLALDLESNLITDVSENCTEWFQRPIDQLLGATLSDLLPRKIVHQCNNARAHSTITTQRENVGRVQSDDAVCDLFVHQTQDRFILELQPVSETDRAGISILDNVQRVLGRLSSIQSAQILLDQAVDELRALTGFHRVKAYRFFSDGSGEIIAESREPQMSSFLGLRFPAQDVPKAARKLYETTPIRIIPNTNIEQTRILSTDPAALDLSLALLRGVIPVHVQYLQNMGVQATLSLPIIVNGKMWGLFAFHHMNEFMLPSERLTSLEILGSSISMLLNSIIYRQRIANIDKCSKVAAVLFAADGTPAGFSTYWDEANADLAKLIKSDGVALLRADQYQTYGACLSETSARQLATLLEADYLDEESSSAPIALDSIIVNYPDIDCGDVAGVLAIPEPAEGYRYLFYFRKDVSEVVRWAGAPTKDIYKADDGFRLNPRASFNEYLDSAQKKSDEFNQEDLTIAESLKDALSIIISALSTQHKHQQQKHLERLELIIRELNHRTRNILALIGSIISQSRNTTHTIEEFIQTLEQRLQALSETLKLLTEFEWKPIQLRLLLQRTLTPYHHYFDTRIHFNGNEISLTPELASMFALIINELASNAEKYGALKNSTGHVNIDWHYNEDNLIFEWIESSGPPVSEPSRKGFGTTLITEALAYEFNADCSLEFLPAGVQVKFIIPQVETTVEPPSNPSRAATHIGLPHQKTSFVALVLEDDYMISREMVRMLKSLGASRVDGVPTLEQAADLIARNEYDIAFLDANIRDQFSGQIALLLHQKGVPFAFATGYGSNDQNLRETACIDILSKPVSKSRLQTVLQLAGVAQ